METDTHLCKPKTKKEQKPIKISDMVLKAKNCQMLVLFCFVFFLILFLCFTYIKRAASRCWISLFRSKTFNMYCRSWSVIRSNTCCVCTKSGPFIEFVFASAEWFGKMIVVSLGLYPVEEASIKCCIFDAWAGVGGNRAARPLGIFLRLKMKWKKTKFKNIVHRTTSGAWCTYAKWMKMKKRWIWLRRTSHTP